MQLSDHIRRTLADTFAALEEAPQFEDRRVGAGGQLSAQYARASAYVKFGQDGVPVLVELLQAARNPAHRAYLVRFLAELGDPRGLEAIRGLARDRTPFTWVNGERTVQTTLADFVAHTLRDTGHGAVRSRLQLQR